MHRPLRGNCAQGGWVCFPQTSAPEHETIDVVARSQDCKRGAEL